MMILLTSITVSLALLASPAVATLVDEAALIERHGLAEAETRVRERAVRTGHSSKSPTPMH